MGKRILLVLLFAGSFSGFSQRLVSAHDADDRTQRYVNLFLKPDQPASASVGRISLFIRKLEEKRSSFKHDDDFLEYVFSKTHQRFLRHYTEYCTFRELLEGGVYNCLTGTALYSLILDHLNISYRIIETNYHIFLVIETNRGDVLFEATDPIDGFVEEPTAVAKRIEKYRNIVPNVRNRTCYRYNANIYNTVSIEQLVGLMYYNLSVNAYNKKLLSTSISYLEQSVKFYKTSRTDEFTRIIFLTLSAGVMNDAERDVCLQQLKSLGKGGLLFASSSGELN